MNLLVQWVRIAYTPAGKVAQFVTEVDSVEEALGQAFDRYNRGSGSAVAFTGPSCSVGDILIVTDTTNARRESDKQVYVVDSFGFKRLSFGFAY